MKKIISSLLKRVIMLYAEQSKSNKLNSHFGDRHENI